MHWLIPLAAIAVVAIIVPVFMVSMQLFSEIMDCIFDDDDEDDDTEK